MAIKEGGEVSVDTKFNLPGSSFAGIQKIIQGYAIAPDQTSLDGLAKLTAMDRTVISRNNKFLIDIGLITAGKKKSATELGKKLGRALEYKQDADAQSYWKEAVQTNQQVSGLVTTIRIKGGMAETEFFKHVSYVSDQKKTSGNSTGVRCVVEVLLAAGLLQEENGKLSVSVAPEQETPPDIAATVASATSVGAAVVNGNGSASSLAADRPGKAVPPDFLMTTGAVPQIAINIQLQLPETENGEVYEKLFRALRENLLNPKQ